MFDDIPQPDGVGKVFVCLLHACFAARAKGKVELGNFHL
jgi:hypothetical protein